MAKLFSPSVEFYCFEHTRGCGIPVALRVLSHAQSNAEGGLRRMKSTAARLQVVAHYISPYHTLQGRMGPHAFFDTLSI